MRLRRANARRKTYTDHAALFVRTEICTCMHRALAAPAPKPVRAVCARDDAAGWLSFCASSSSTTSRARESIDFTPCRAVVACRAVVFAFVARRVVGCVVVGVFGVCVDVVAVSSRRRTRQWINRYLRTTQSTNYECANYKYPIIAAHSKSNTGSLITSSRSSCTRIIHQHNTSQSSLYRCWHTG